MKLKLALAALILAALIGCNENKKTEEEPNHLHATDTVTHAHSEMDTQKLVLNEGKKWKLDEATRNNINAIRQTIQTVSSAKQKDFAKAAADLEGEANRLVSQCRMSGKDHDMLHLWLEDFLSALKQLKDSPKENQPAAFEKTESLVKEFDYYFE